MRSFILCHSRVSGNPEPRDVRPSLDARFRWHDNEVSKSPLILNDSHGGAGIKGTPVTPVSHRPIVARRSENHSRIAVQRRTQGLPLWTQRVDISSRSIHRKKPPLPLLRERVGVRVVVNATPLIRRHSRSKDGRLRRPMPPPSPASGEKGWRRSGVDATARIVD